MLDTYKSSYTVPALGIAAYSGVGKTTLLTKVIAELRHMGIRVAVIKHAHHNFEIDHPGKDSYRLRTAGAVQIVVAGGGRVAVIREGTPCASPDLDDLISNLDLQSLDLVLAEGFKHSAIPKIEVYCPHLQHPALYPDDPNIIAVISDQPEILNTVLPLFHRDHCKEIAQFIASQVGSKIVPLMSGTYLP